MPKFPTKESEVVSLLETMIAGYLAHAGDFPGVNIPALIGMYNFYDWLKNNQAQTLAAVRSATAAKNDKLKAIKKIMSDCLKKSQVDTVDNPEKLSLIGWGPRQQPQRPRVPESPVSLRSETAGQGTVRLRWESFTGCGAAARNYIIQRRQQPAGGGEFDSWSIVGTALETEIELSGQPEGIRAEYRVKAANTTGQSPPSNTAAVVL